MFWKIYFRENIFVFIFIYFYKQNVIFATMHRYLVIKMFGKSLILPLYRVLKAKRPQKGPMEPLKALERPFVLLKHSEAFGSIRKPSGAFGSIREHSGAFGSWPHQSTPSTRPQRSTSEQALRRFAQGPFQGVNRALYNGKINDFYEKF